MFGCSCHVLTYYRDQIRKLPGVVNMCRLTISAASIEMGTWKTALPVWYRCEPDPLEIYSDWSAPTFDPEAFKNDLAGAAVPRVLANKNPPENR
jgi:hypothetical protein